jgi:hypothetical protein
MSLCGRKKTTMLHGQVSKMNKDENKRGMMG